MLVSAHPRVLDLGQAGRKGLQFLGVRPGIDRGSRQFALQPRKNLAIQAPAVSRGAVLEQGVQIFRDVLECECQHKVRPGTRMEPLYLTADTGQRRGPGWGPWRTWGRAQKTFPAAAPTNSPSA